MKLVGYHGTNKHCENKILSEGFKITKFLHEVDKTQEMPGDLGNGIYAFTIDEFSDPLENAKDFALTYRVDNCEDLSILSLEANVEENNLLDFDDLENLKLFNNYKKKATARAEKIFQSVVNNNSKKRDNRDGIYIELLIKRYTIPCKVIKKRTYTSFHNEAKKSNMVNGTELCIRDKSRIKVEKYDSEDGVSYGN